MEACLVNPLATVRFDSGLRSGPWEALSLPGIWENFANSADEQTSELQVLLGRYNGRYAEEMDSETRESKFAR